MHTEISHADEQQRQTRTAAHEEGAAHSNEGAMVPGLPDALLIQRLQATAGNAAVADLLSLQRTPAVTNQWVELGKQLRAAPAGSRFYIIAERVTAARLSQAEAIDAVNRATEASGFELGTISGPDGSVAITEKVALTRETTTNLSAVLVKSDGTVSYVAGDYMSGPEAGRYGQMLGNIRTKPPYSGDISSSAGSKRVVVRSSVPKGAAAGPEVRVDPVTGEIGGPAPKGPAGGGQSGSPRGAVSGQGVPSGQVSGEIGELGELGGAAPAAEGPLVAEGVAAGGMLAVSETAAIFGFALTSLVLPLVLGMILTAEDEEAAEAERKEIMKALNVAWPQIKAELAKRQGELDNLIKQTKEGQTIYANVRFVIEPPGEGAGRGSYDPQPEKTELKLYFVGINLGTTPTHERDGNQLVVSIPLYVRQVDAPGATSRDKMAEAVSLSG